MSRIKLKQTCSACPEQYDVYIDGEMLGYMRLRHGYFYAEYKDEKVYEAEPNGDGIFDGDERLMYLNAACMTILTAHNKVDGEDLFEIEY